MFDYCALYEQLDNSSMRAWLDTLPKQVEVFFSQPNNGNFVHWQSAVSDLPEIPRGSVDFNSDIVRAGDSATIDLDTRQRITTQLQALRPWRKGPFELYGVYIDSEWCSNQKWSRLEAHIQPLTGRKVLDIGCGNGYFGYRMLGAGASWVLGIDPYLLYVMQHFALRHFLPEQPAFIAPIGIESVPFAQLDFDTIFSMGILYHRRSPFDHLLEIRTALNPDIGELVLETIVVDGPEGYSLVPKDRYAKMRNVWFIPSCLTLESWLKRCGYRDIRKISVTRTDLDEQRATAWMTFESLADFLDPLDPTRTCEGYPAPQRAIFLAKP